VRSGVKLFFYQISNKAGENVYFMRRLKIILVIILFVPEIYFSVSCKGSDQFNKQEEINTSAGEYTVYIINNNLHTGIVIPVNSESISHISSLKYFKNFELIDIGWGEEKFYQDPQDSFCMGARAILLPNTSVVRMEGYGSIADCSISWSDFTVRLILSKDQFIKLAKFIDDSFRKETGDELIITSKKHSGHIMFFKSVYRYHLFNTCNTWVAAAIKYAGFDVSPFFIITATQLYNEIKDQGTVLKSLK